MIVTHNRRLKTGCSLNQCGKSILANEIPKSCLEIAVPQIVFEKCASIIVYRIVLNDSQKKSMLFQIRFLVEILCQKMIKNLLGQRFQEIMFSFRLWVVGGWLVVIGCWLLVIGCWLLVIGSWLLFVCCSMLVVDCWLLVLGYWVLVVGSWLLVVDDWLLIIGCWLLAVG